MNSESDDLEYAGFWIRFVAFLLDSIVVLIVLVPIVYAIYGDAILTNPDARNWLVDLFVMYLLPAIAFILLWLYRSATPGKEILGLAIVSATGADKLTAGQLLVRYFGYYLNIFCLGLGFVWIAFDARKQGWHDKISGTVVIKT